MRAVTNSIDREEFESLLKFIGTECSFPHGIKGTEEFAAKGLKYAGEAVLVAVTTTVWAGRLEAIASPPDLQRRRL
jgi:hypothetical protein